MANWADYFLEGFNKSQDRSLSLANAAIEMKFKKWIEEQKIKSDTDKGIAELAEKGIVQAPTNTVDYARAMGAGQRPFTAYGQQFMSKPNMGVETKPLFTVGGNNQIIPLGNVPKGSQVISPSSMTSPQQKQEIKLQGELQKNLETTILPEINGLYAGLQKLEEYAKKMPEFKSGIGEGISAKLQTGAAKLANEKWYTDYQSTLNRKVTPFARNLNQAKGSLSDRDIMLMIEGLGKADLPIENKKQIFNDLQDEMGLIVYNGMKSVNISPEDLKKKSPKAYELLTKSHTTIEVNGENYRVPLLEIDEFKKDMGVE